MLEKQHLPPPIALKKQTSSRVKHCVLLLAVAGLIGWKWFGAGMKAFSRPKPFQLGGSVWWSTCPDSPSTYCSFLTVPLNYLDPKADEVVSLALRMIPATVPPAEQLGYLFINPGGPGGSGTGAVVDLAPLLSVIYEGRYNLVSWDPRGVNMSAPALGCFENQGDANRFVHDLEHVGLSFDARGSPSLGFDSTTANASELQWVSKVDGFARSLNAACQSSADPRMLSASSTAFTARDMRSIMLALGEEKINYWGFSYGTILGSTFSAMFPELVGRVILDGVSDAELYTTDLLEWGRSGMNTTHEVIEGFFHHCARSGPTGCAFAGENSTAEELTQKYAGLLEGLRDVPMAIGKSAVGPGVLTASDVQYTMFHALYQPRTWPHMATLLAALHSGNGSEMYSVANLGANALGRGKHHARNPFHRVLSAEIESSSAIMCSDTDTDRLKNTTVEDVREYMTELRETTGSPSADMWAIWMLPCVRWGAKAIERYSGPWSVAAGLKKTKYPILFFSNTADPVTPLNAAEKVAAAFGKDSATLVVQEGFGHCSVAHPGLCTAKTMRAYLLNGTVPAYGTRCKADENFIFPRPDSPSIASSLSREDARLMEALVELSEVGGRWGMGPGR